MLPQKHKGYELQLVEDLFWKQFGVSGAKEHFKIRPPSHPSSIHLLYLSSLV